MLSRLEFRDVTALVVGLLLAVVSASAQTTWHVDDDAPDDPGAGDPTVSDPAEDGSAAHPFDAIQEGIDAAVDADTVLVLNGTYVGVGNRALDFGGRAIAVRSANGAADCVIDCQDEGRAFFFHNGESAAAIVDGFTILNGEALWNGPGGGHGGAISCYGSSPTIVGCVIRACWAEQDGGGIFCDWAAVPTISDCTIAENLAGGYGGAICCYNDSNLTIADCTIADNQGIAGSGLAFFACNPELSNCVITGNESAGGT